MSKPRITAQSALENAHLVAQDQLARLREILQDYDAPDEFTHWGHVGTLCHVNQLIAQAIEHLRPSK